MAQVAELQQERAGVWAQARALNDLAESEHRSLTAEEREQWDRMHVEIETLGVRIADQQRLQNAPAPESRGDGPTERPGAGDGPTREQRAQEQREAFLSWCRGGVLNLSVEQRQMMSSTRQMIGAEEARAMGVAPNSAGGYFVPDELRRSIEQAMAAFGGMRESSQVFATSTGNDLYVPTVNDTSNVGELVGEHQPVTAQDVAVGQRLFRAYMYSSKEVLVSLELLQDSAFDIESLLTSLFAERIGRITNTHFTSGSGADRPTGLVQGTTLGVTAAATGAVTADELINLEYSNDRAYRVNARWMFHSNTLRDIRKLKDGEGRYMWQPGMQSGNPNTLNGYPYTVNDDMPTMATTAKAIAFGQLSKYLIRDVMGFRVIRLDERYAENGQVAFFAFSRCDGALLDAGTHPVMHLAMA